MNKNGQNLSLLWLFCDQKAKKPTAFGAANTYIKENPQLIGFDFPQISSPPHWIQHINFSLGIAEYFVSTLSLLGRFSIECIKT